jgi:hypothetical protein
MALHYKLFYALNASFYHNDLQIVQMDEKFLTSCEAIAFCMMPAAPRNLVVNVHVQYRPYVTRNHTSLPSPTCFVFGETWVQTLAFVQVKFIPWLTRRLMTVSSRTAAPWGYTIMHTSAILNEVLCGFTQYPTQVPERYLYLRHVPSNLHPLQVVIQQLSYISTLTV